MTWRAWKGLTLLTRLAALMLLCGLCVAGAPAEVHQNDPYQSWARVLTRFVNDRGQVDFRALARDRAELDAFLGYIAHVSPRSAPGLFATREAKLAYYINAYNALAMLNVVDSDFPTSLSGFTKVKFFGLTRFAIGGERMSLYALENDVIRPQGDERVHFALNCMSVGCPRLPRAPFRAEDLDGQLDAQAREFFESKRNLQVDREHRLARVSSILKFYTGDFLARAPTLIAYINLYTRTQIPSDYRVEFIDYDWTVNDQRRDQGSS
jgi:hypothetical protein